MALNHDHQAEEDGAIALAASGDPVACRLAAAKADPETWVPLFLDGCADMLDGMAPQGLAQWMAAADMMEDEDDIRRLAEASAACCAGCMVHWDRPDRLGLSGLTAFSHGVSPLIGCTDSAVLVMAMRSLRSMVSETDQHLNADIIECSSSLAYMTVMFGRDIREMREAAGLLTDIFAEVLDSMEAAGEVPEEMDYMPIDELRAYCGDRLTPYRVIAREYDAVLDRFTGDQVEDLVRYWSGERGDRLLKMMTEVMDLGVMHSDTGDRSYLDACAKSARMYVLKYMRIRK